MAGELIPRRYARLRRDVDACFDSDLGRGHRCRLCSATGRGDIFLPRAQREGHLAEHRGEALVDDEEDTP